LLDLHGNPGGETEDKPCGRSNEAWCFEDWRRDEALEILSMVAERYKGEPHVTGFQVGGFAL
jgi:aryl-phospho-beta-D-glucosidase BglC (GH1 family)